jgi:hypothetical protein
MTCKHDPVFRDDGRKTKWAHVSCDCWEERCDRLVQEVKRLKTELEKKRECTCSSCHCGESTINLWQSRTERAEKDAIERQQEINCLRMEPCQLPHCVARCERAEKQARELAEALTDAHNLLEQDCPTVVEKWRKLIAAYEAKEEK